MHHRVPDVATAMSELLSIVLALVAACANAISNVIQRAANRDEADVKTLSLRLVKDLLHRPLWFAGIGAVTVSFVLQASALHFGPLARVEPLLVVELPLTFIGAAVFLDAQLGKLEWSAALLMTVGLGALVYFLQTSGHGGRASIATWAIGLAISEGTVAALVIGGRQAAGDSRAALYGGATGIQFGTTAALMNGAVHHISHGVVSLLESWQAYGMVLTGLFAMFLVQNAMQSGKIVAAQPGITLLDPFVAILWGVFAFHEDTTRSMTYLVLATVGGIAMIAGALLLSRSRVLQLRGDASDVQAGARRPPEGGSPTMPEGALSG